jgi:hypothetical protein
VIGRHIQEALSGVAVLVFIGAIGFLAAHCLTGCAAAKPALAEQAYREEQEDCLKRFESKNDRTTCVNQVRARWATDGGDR